jgi:hypothetical protein
VNVPGVPDFNTGKLTFRYPVKGDDSNRTISGADKHEILSEGNGTRNYFELIAIDDQDKTHIWDYDVAVWSDPNAASIALNMSVRQNATYHILILSGHVDFSGIVDGKYTGTASPTLFAAGYTTQPINADSPHVTIAVTPLIVDTSFELTDTGNLGTEDAVLSRVEAVNGQIASLSPTASGQEWQARFFIAGNEQTIGGKIEATDDGLSPLKLAEYALNPANTNVEFIDSDTDAATIRQGSYTYAIGSGTAVTTDMEITSTLGTLLAPIPATFDTEKTGSVQFNLTYAPFGLPDTAWANYEDFQVTPPLAGGVGGGVVKSAAFAQAVSGRPKGA